MGREIKETVYVDAVGISLADFLAALTQIASTISPDLLASATVEIVGGTDEDSGEFQISYSRPETDAEAAKRMQDEANAGAHRKAVLEAQYSRLKAELEAMHLQLGK